MKSMKTNQAPVDAYVRRYGFIREKIERLQRLADCYFGHDPNAIRWDHVGDLERIEATLDAMLAIFDGDQAGSRRHELPGRN